MPHTELMGWVPSRSRWQKSYRGRLYVISCRQLGTLATRRHSRALANAWWEAKQRQLDAVSLIMPPPPTATPTRDPVARWIASRELDARIDPRKTAAVSQIRSCLTHWQRCNLGLDEHGVEAYHAVLRLHVAEGRWSLHTAAKHWSRFRQFVRWCYAMRLIELPRNLATLKFPLLLRCVRTIPDVTPYVDAAGDRLRLCYLLMLNCGMQQADISALRRDEVHGATLTRRRSKTQVLATYPLWPDTLQLLQRLTQRAGDLALLTSQGNPLANNRGSPRYDTIQQMHGRLCVRAMLPRVPLKLFRKTAADAMNRYAPEHVEAFLAHSPRSIAERHYITPNRGSFTAAVLLLRDALGISHEEHAEQGGGVGAGE
jgi:hypothetical protein